MKQTKPKDFKRIKIAREKGATYQQIADKINSTRTGETVSYQYILTVCKNFKIKKGKRIKI